MKLYLFSLMASSFLAASAVAAENPTNAAASPAPAPASKMPPASAKQGVTFAKDIQPIFETACVRCHGATNPRAGVRLDTLDATLKGGTNGKMVVVGDSAKSVLVTKITTVGPNGAFSHPRQPLDNDQIGLIRAWIDQGAK